MILNGIGTGDAARRVVIVTGASSGIGRSTAVMLAKQGFDLVLIGRSLEALTDTESLCNQAGDIDVTCETADLAKEGALSGIVRAVGKAHTHLFALVNNAGVMYPEPLLSGTMTRWREMMDINYFAPLEGCIAAIEVMREHGRPGHIVNVSSISADMETFGAYSASKRALEIIGKTLRTEIQREPIRLTTIAPGATATNLSRGFTPESQQRLYEQVAISGYDVTAGAEEIMSSPDDVARAILFALETPVTVEIERIIIRPPVDLHM